MSHRSEKDTEAKSTFDAFRGAAADLGVALNVDHLKVNLSSPVAMWQHENIVRSTRGKKVLSATLTRIASNDPIARASVTSQKAAAKQILAATKVVTGALARIVYGVRGAGLETSILNPRSELVGSRAGNCDADAADRLCCFVALVVDASHRPDGGAHMVCRVALLIQNRSAPRRLSFASRC